jgi:WD40 repeat protein
LTLKGHRGAINSIHFSSDGRQVVTTGVDKTVRVWELESAGAAIRPLEGYGWSLKSRFSPDGQLIVASTNYRRGITLWDAATGRLVRVVSADTGREISAFAFSPVDHYLLAVGHFGKHDGPYVSLWDIDAGTELARLPGATGEVGALAFSPDGKYLVGGSGTPDPLKVWEVATRRLIRRPGGLRGYCSSLDFAKDGTLLVSGSSDGSAIVWSTATWEKTQTFQNPDACRVRDTALSPDGRTLAVASYAGNVHLWDVAAGKLLDTLTGHSGQVTAVAFAPDGRTLASGRYDQTVRLWNVETWRELMQLDSGSVELGMVFTLAFSPDGQNLLAGGWSAGVWSTAPLLWADADRAAEKLRLLLNSNADFRSRVRLLSEHLRLHEALAQLDEKDVRVQAALAAARANWHAAQQRWPEAVREIDRLLAADPSHSQGWLRTPELLRLATALLHQDRPADAARLLQGGAKRRTQDGLPAVAQVTGLGLRHLAEGGGVRITGLDAASPAARGRLLAGDLIVKVNGVELTKDTAPNFGKLIEGNVGTKIRLTVRRAGSKRTEDVDLVKERYRVDEATGEWLFPLLAALDEQLTEDPGDVGLLELRAELAGQ